MNERILTIRTQTSAFKAARYLKKSGIHARVISVDPSVTSKGCGWGIVFDVNMTDKIKNMLEEKGIEYGDVLSGGI